MLWDELPHRVVAVVESAKKNQIGEYEVFHMRKSLSII